MDYLRVGVIVRPHGVHGEVKVMSLSDTLERFMNLDSAYIEKKGSNYEPITVLGAKLMDDGAVLKLSGCTTREQAELLRNSYVCVDRAHAITLPEDSNFIVDLIGCSVFDNRKVYYGKLVDVYETGANDVYEIKGDCVLRIPALKRLVLSVDVPSKRILLDADVLEEVGLFED